MTGQTRAAATTARTTGGTGQLRARPLVAALVFACALMAVLVLCANAFAASGTVYSCTIVPSYKHPYTGEVEDSAGASSQATGQAMVESCLSGKGMLEVTDGGKYYLTLRLSLIDYTRDQTFQVQEWGSSGWENPKLGVTATGEDSNGTTNDVCIQVPSQKTIVRVSMYVESMGRNVVFFCYPKGFEKGTPKGFKATRVTSSSKTSGSSASKQEKSDKEEKKDSKAKDSAATAKSEDAAEEADGDTAADPQTGEASASSADELAGSSVTSNAQGLSLSTAQDASAASQQGGQTQGSDSATQAAATQTGLGVGESILVNVVSIAGSGLILMAAAAGIVYVFRRNWKRWGGDDPDDYSDEYGSDDEL